MYKLCRRRVAVLAISLLLVVVLVLASLGLGLHTSCVRTVAEVNTQLASYGLGGARCGKQRLDTAADCNIHQARARERLVVGRMYEHVVTDMHRLSPHHLDYSLDSCASYLASTAPPSGESIVITFKWH